MWGRVPGGALKVQWLVGNKAYGGWEPSVGGGEGLVDGGLTCGEVNV